MELTAWEKAFQEEGGWYARNVHVNALAKEESHLWQTAKPPKLYQRSEEYKDKAFIRLVLIDQNGNRAYTRPYYLEDMM